MNIPLIIRLAKEHGLSEKGAAQLERDLKLMEDVEQYVRDRSFEQDPLHHLCEEFKDYKKEHLKESAPAMPLHDPSIVTIPYPWEPYPWGDIGSTTWKPIGPAPLVWYWGGANF